MTRFAELLTSEQVERIHEASLEILETVGLLVRNEEARSRFAEHGCRVDAENQVVKFPRAVVEHFRAASPPTFTFRGRDPQYDRTIPDDGPLMVTGSSAPNIIDPQTGEERRSRSDDIARIAYLVNELPGYDVFSISTLADDAPPGQFSLSRFYPALKNCLKPVRGSAPSLEEAEKILHLGALIAGGEDAYWERPFITFQYCSSVSPLTMDVESTEKLIRFTERQVPSYGVVVPNAGLTSPLTLTGTLAQCNAEFLAQAVLVQMSHPGTPLIYEILPTVADMRTGAYASGAIETGILLMGCAQMARYYNVPSGGFVGLTNAKVNDAQSGFETGMSTLAALLAGVDLLNMGGLLDALMAFDFAKAVIDNEIALMLKRVIRGLEFSEDNLALDVIAEVGPGGMYMDTSHTLQRMRTTALLPEIADRSPRQRWEAEGALDAHARAMKRVHEILTRDNPAVFAPDVDARIRAEFEGLVAGDAVVEWLSG
ncbi:MAG: trimethylamine methyltransferase family protein [Chloroflexi bacterium]|jgi:trimethylamine--corrinoid protein Co-methyltransferase|nr:trimethylamine methyltransferase family protein [Chloroflexota bacterium]